MLERVEYHSTKRPTVVRVLFIHLPRPGRTLWYTRYPVCLLAIGPQASALRGYEPSDPAAITGSA